MFSHSFVGGFSVFFIGSSDRRLLRQVQFCPVSAPCFYLVLRLHNALHSGLKDAVRRAQGPVQDEGALSNVQVSQGLDVRAHVERRQSR